MQRRFDQLDVFSAEPLMGNPLAVVHDAQGLSDATMAAFARWTNLSETTFLLPPTEAAAAAGADYRVRIFTPGAELPFAGHPTLGSCHAWLAAGGVPRDAGIVVQECGVGLVRVRERVQACVQAPQRPDGDGIRRLAFAAPPQRSSSRPLDAGEWQRISAATGLQQADVLHHRWLDNGPHWCAVLLRSAAEVLAVRPDFAQLAGLNLGLVGAHPAGDGAGHDADWEVRVFVPAMGVPEDPVTGAFNAALAQWLIGAGLAPMRYVAAQGTALGRAGRVHVAQADGATWIGGDVAGRITGSVGL